VTEGDNSMKNTLCPIEHAVVHKLIQLFVMLCKDCPKREICRAQISRLIKEVQDMECKEVAKAIKVDSS